MTTSCRVSFGQNALAIKDDGLTPTVIQGGLQAYGDLSSVQSGLTPSAPYATFEPNYWLLDGNFKIAPATGARGGWVSTGMSAGSAAFDFGTDPMIRLVFDSIHSTDGLTLYFSNSGDYADSITIAFYNSSNVLIRTDNYTPSAVTFATSQAVANFKRIDITFLSTNRAERYARLSRIDFDTLTQFTGTEIKAAKVVEQINPIAVELPINTVDLELFSADGDFSIVEPSGFFENLQYKEPLDVYEEVHGDTLYIGRFYLDKWESKTANLATFEASDAIGLLEGFTYYGGIWFSYGLDTSLIDSDALIDDIFSAAGIDYEMDASLNNISVFGWIPVTNCREALQQVCIAIGAYATCARSNKVIIRPLELAEDLVSYDHTLTSAEKGMSSPLTLRPLVTGVEVTAYEYAPDVVDATSAVIYDSQVATGDHVIIFSEPAFGSGWGDSTATFTFTLIGWNYSIINVTVAGRVIGTSIGFIESGQLKSVYNGSLPAGTPENVIRITDGKVIGVAVGQAVAQRIYDYYQARYLQKTKLFASLVAPGDSVLVDVQNSKQLAGIVERMETDLAGGYVSQVEIVGVII